MKHIIKKLKLRDCVYCGAIAVYLIDNRALCQLHYTDEMRYINQGQSGYCVKGIQSSWASIQGKVNKELSGKVKKNLLASEVKSIVARHNIVILLDDFFSGKINLIISYDNNHTLSIEHGMVCFVCLVSSGYNPISLRDDFIAGKIEVCYKRAGGRIVEYYK